MSTISERADRRLRALTRAGQDPELLHHAQVVPDGPVFGDEAIAKPKQVSELRRDFAFGGWHSTKRRCTPVACPDSVDDDQIVFGYLAPLGSAPLSL